MEFARQEIAMVFFAALLAAMLDVRIKQHHGGPWLPYSAWQWLCHIILRPMLPLPLSGSCYRCSG